VRSRDQKIDVVTGLEINAFSQSKIDATVNELKEEKAMVADLLPGA
jgi:malate dehydrogenase